LPRSPQTPQPPSAADTSYLDALPAGIHAGTSGWAYPTWKPGFYPAGLSSKRFLEHYASRLNSVEVNYTFRTLPSATLLANWLAVTSPTFRFSFKAPQRITHFSRLRDCHTAVAEFVAALEPAHLAGKLGPLLFQLPPNFKANSDLLTTFLSAPALSSQQPPLIAFEFRHESWFTEDIYAILRAHNAALCIAESDDLATPEVHTAPTHTCYRLRREGGYTLDELTAFAEKFSTLASTRDVYIYFKHEDEPTGALNAVAFLEACTARAGKR
jgi:uncharacterized protein YecE (DUF72 family)